MTSEEIKKLTNYLVEVFKGIFATKEDIEGINGRLNILQNSVDIIAKDNLVKNQEMPVLNYRMKNAEDWIDQAAGKIGLQFRH